MAKRAAPRAEPHTEEVELQGHIIDSLLLPKVTDEILTRGVTFTLKDIKIGQSQSDPSHARIEVPAASEALLAEILESIHEHGAAPLTQHQTAPQIRCPRSTAVSSQSAGFRQRA